VILLRDRFLYLNSLQAWWPVCPEGVYPLLSEAPVVTVMQCTEEVAGPLTAFAFRRKPFCTLFLDLSRPESELWHGIQSRTRHYIKQASKTDYRVLVNQDTEKAFRLTNEFIRRSRFRPPLSMEEWSQIKEHGDVFLLEHGGGVLAATVVLVDHPTRARMLLGATADRSDARYHQLVGPFNKFLTWHICTYYKAKGIRWYDFGGVDLDPTSPLYSISQFKLAFGGRPVSEYILRLSARPVLRSALRGIFSARLKLRSAVAGH